MILKLNIPVLQPYFIKKAAFLLAILLNFSLFSQPQRVHLSFAEPDNSKHSNINVTWSDKKVVQSSAVKLGNKEQKLNYTVNATVDEHNGEIIYKAILEKLKPSTTYFYKCGSDETGWSETFSFITAPKIGDKKPFTVGVFGDTQNNEFNEDFQKTKEVIKYLSEIRPDFTIHTGDLVNNGSVEEGWIKLLNTIQPLVSRAPMMPTLGNHDIVNAPGENFQKPYPIFYKLFSLPGDGLDYSFKYGNVHFVSIFSGYAIKAAEEGVLRYGVETPERKWLEEDLERARNTKGIDWIIVITHYPLHSFGWSNVKEWKERITPILDKYNVDLCLSGHRHVYERHHPLRDGKPVGEGEGTVYITNGTSGGSPQGIGGFDLPTMAFTPRERMYNYAVMKVSGNTLKYEVFNLEQIKIDEFELIKKK